MNKTYFFLITGCRSLFTHVLSNKIGVCNCTMNKFSTVTPMLSKSLKGLVKVAILDEKTNYIHVKKLIEDKSDEVQKQADNVRKLKDEKIFTEYEIKEQIKKLEDYKKALQLLEQQNDPFELFNKSKFFQFVKQIPLYSPANNMYEAIAGFFDYDPIGCQIFANIQKEWEKHFIIKEKMLTMKCPSITSESVLEASGHVKKFTNYMIMDSGSTAKFRLDHLIKDALNKILLDIHTSKFDEETIKMVIANLEGTPIKELMKIIKKFKIVSPISGQSLINPVDLNLMFPVSIGQKDMKGYLRPESSQGMFIKFKELLDANNNKFPFACAQFATVYRNEIQPENELLRMREFNVAEIAQFYYPSETKCDKLGKIADTELWLYSACNQLENEMPQLMKIGRAVKEGLIENEYLAYYMARTQQFLTNIGIAKNKLRFRQHINNELAHYSSSCWDAECSTSLGWIECVSCADRGIYDLNEHSFKSGNVITVDKWLKTPSDILTTILNIEAIKEKYGNDVRQIIDKIANLSANDVLELKTAIEQEKTYTIDTFDISKELVHSFKINKSTVQKITPAVVEPSFGMDRIFYCLLEHTFRTREVETRSFLSMPPSSAPYLVDVLPLIGRLKFDEMVDSIVNELADNDILMFPPIQKSDITIGKRYVKLDKYGVPFVITVDEDTLHNTCPTVTLRERDSTHQIRIPISEAAPLLRSLRKGSTTWEELLKIYEKVKIA